MIFSIMTFNVRVHVPSDGINAWPHRVERVAKLINQEQPMIMGTHGFKSIFWTPISEI